MGFNLRIQEPNGDYQDATTQEKIRVRLFLQGDEKNPEEVRIELDSEADLFFYYQHIATRVNFREIKTKQQLQIDFGQYANVCVKSFMKCEKDSQHYYVMLTIDKDLTGILQIVQTSEYKDIEMIAFDFQSASEEGIRQQITFKYGALKSKLSLMDGRLQDINELIRIKNPSLLLQIQKSAAGRSSPRKRKY
eukprot:TRINITY_DN2840_c0_g1_i1.p1 TRINITY_DN2840_c0_g1~~TRINITY_DN2840_c0_g1_i1.p1  ORF type:complete len:192 (+),score=43.99 TRINITY_DN2840_c0_g1_i1:123-698(+)